MLSLEEARARMLAGVEPLPAEDVELGQALARVLAEPVSSRLTLPPWDNSAMDGFAVRAADLTGASEQEPRRLRVIGEAAAGRAVTSAVERDACFRILTGAPLPAGADAVVPLEDTDAPAGATELQSAVTIFRPPARGAHIRRAGSDLRLGQSLLAAGDVLG
ncbi:MAG: molybdopterin molybdenumtransferase MoeA, partial [Chloroflexota bacterium]|nr:molybdopterin molybdenumtransferase MoeA [Chloroflexota bacterium]